MFEELHELLEDKRISKNELLAILKEKAQKISVFDLMEANQYILQDVEFVQDKYQDDFRQAYVKQFQKAKKLKVTGKVDYATAKKLKLI